MSITITTGLTYFQEGNQAGYHRTPTWLGNYVKWCRNTHPNEFIGLDEEIPLPEGVVWGAESITFTDEQTLTMFILRWS